MFKIGDFARIGRVTVRTLHHYEELGLLAPVRSDPMTGYRYYGLEQLPRLNRILALKDLGLSLDEIGLLLSQELSATGAAGHPAPQAGGAGRPGGGDPGAAGPGGSPPQADRGGRQDA